MRRTLSTCSLCLALSLFGLGCRSSPFAWVKLEAPEGHSISFPGAPDTIAGRDGPVDFRIDAFITHETARFEIGWFQFMALDASEREQLQLRVERGLFANGARVVSRLETSGEPGRVELVLHLSDGRRGHYLILFTSARTMLQVSVVGTPPGEWERGIRRFFDSLVLRKVGPFPRDPARAGLDTPSLGVAVHGGR